MNQRPRVSTPGLIRVMLVGISAAALLSAAFLAKTQLQVSAKQSQSNIPSNCNTWNTPFCNAAMTPVPGAEHVFQLAQSYPRSSGRKPWYPAADPQKQPAAYAAAVLAYFYEGNIHGGPLANDFDPRTNHRRQWYNAPFQDLGTYGREFVHGLTFERNSRPGELAPEQRCETEPSEKCSFNNYAVGFYNGAGASVLSNIWSPWRARAGAQPDVVAGASVPNGTVAAKLLFTTATLDKVPFLTGAPVWKPYIFTAINNTRPSATDPRSFVDVRLLQIDFAVKDPRGGTSGWVFGTFVYGGGPGYHGKPLGRGWRNVAPVGVMWGNDPGYAPPSPLPSPHNSGLKETWLDPDVTMMHYGYQGRLNGPIDNPVSSCMSCHGSGEIATGAAPGSGMIAPSISQTPKPVSFWFRNVGPSEPFDGSPAFISTGFSLQVMDGIRNYYTYYGATPAPTQALRAARIRKIEARTAKQAPPRDGGPTH